jgi:sterol desaturase/sphingolipid hydroxylase (fatty acid hydroxylase superfamily)
MGVTLGVLAAAVVMMGIEAARPGRHWPRVGGWWARALLLNAVQVGMVFLAGSLWNGWMERHRLWSADRLGIVGGALVGYLVITFVYYWWHRWRHSSPTLWRWVHQIHHSPQRIEIITSFYKHPIKLLVNSVLSSAILYLVVGVGREAASLSVLLTGLAELFYHWNVATPVWLGYVIQRPESHCVHHEEGLHSYNYSDLPIWDMLFGTFRNPQKWEARCGFASQGELRFGEMLRGVDVHRKTETAQGL